MINSIIGTERKERENAILVPSRVTCWLSLTLAVLTRPVQILALHLLQAVLPSWDKTERAKDMKGLVEKLFGFLGSLLTTCSSDVPFLRGGPLASRVLAGGRVCEHHLAPCLISHRVHPAEAEGPAPGLADRHPQQHPGGGGGGPAAHAALAGPVERPHQQAHQLPAAVRQPRLRGQAGRRGGCLAFAPARGPPRNVTLT